MTAGSVAAAAADHWVYTNAEGPGGVGFRWLDPLGRPLAPGARLRRWVAGLELAATPEPGVETATAVIAERTEAGLEVWLARAVAGFGQDAVGRPGDLIEVLTARVEEGRDRHLHAASLLRHARALALPAAGPRRLARLLDERRQTAAVGRQTVSLAALRALGPSNLERFVGASEALVAGRRRRVEVAIELPARRTVEESAAALSGALPPRLRLATPWSCGLEDRSPSIRVRAAGAAGATDDVPIEGLAADLVAWLAPRLESGDERTILELVGDWQIRSWDEVRRRCKG